MELARPEEEVVHNYFLEFYLSQNLFDVLRITGPHLSVLQPWKAEFEHLPMLPVQLLHQLVAPSLIARTDESQLVPNSGCGHLLKWFQTCLRSTAGQASAGLGCHHCQRLGHRPSVVEHRPCHF